jgi:hypothetical protein
MRPRLYQIVMAVCQVTIFVCVVIFGGGPDAGGIQGGIIAAAIFTATIIIWQDLPPGIIRCSVAVLYVLAFATMYHAWIVSDQTGSPPSVIGGILMGVFGCATVACGVVTVNWTVQLLGRLLGTKFGSQETLHAERADELGELIPNGLKPEGSNAREPVLGRGAPEALYYVVSSVVLTLLAQWLIYGHP